MGTEKRVKSKHIDKWVLYLFAGMSLLTLAALTYKNANYYDCSIVEADIRNENNTPLFRIGQAISFSGSADNATEWMWDFGDSTGFSGEREVLHSYKIPGEYLVRLKVNDKCLIEEKIVVLDSLMRVDSTKFPVFEIPDALYVGDWGKFKDQTEGATTWEWRFDGSRFPSSYDRETTYKFNSQGEKWVTLIVNGNEAYAVSKKVQVYRKKIAVNDFSCNDGIKNGTEIGIDCGGDCTPCSSKPIIWDVKDKPIGGGDEGVKPKTKFPPIDKKEMMRKVNALMRRKTSLESFASIFCSGEETSVILNGKTMPLKKFYKKRVGKNKAIGFLSFNRNDETGCIKSFTINY